MKRSGWWFALVLTGLGCSESSMERLPADGTGAEAGVCFRDADCTTGLSCVDFRCVSADDGLPPEEEEAHTFLRPAASDSYVFALSPEADSLAIIDPVSLSIEAVKLPEEPLALQVAPGADRVVVVSRQGRALSVVDKENGATKLVSVDTPRRFPALSLSPDGRWAVLWTPDGELPDAGAEGIVALVDVDALRTGEASPVLELAAGRRHTNVFFRADAGVAKDAVIVGHQEIVVLDLTLPSPSPLRIALPDAYAQLTGREALSPPEGGIVLLRSLSTSDLGVFDVAARTFSSLSLPAVASDLDLTVDGTKAVAVLRETSQVARFSLPDGDDLDLIDVALPGTDCEANVDPCLIAPGQAVLSPDGTSAVLFTNARHSESFGRVFFETGDYEVFARLQKLVRTIGLSPDGKNAIVLHRPDPSSTVADLYERTVDRSEGYSVVHLDEGVAQLKLTDKVPPVEFVWAPQSAHAAVTLRDDPTRTWRVEAIDLKSLVVSSLDLASAPQFAGPLPGQGTAPRVWVTQVHSAGRISFIDLAERTVRTATGYELNAEIE